MLSDLHKLVASAETETDWAKLRGIADDADIFIDLGKLWQAESLEKAIGAYQTAVSISTDPGIMEDSKTVDYRTIRTSSNLGSLFLLQGNIDTAERTFQEGLEKLAADDGKDAEVLKTELAFNLARAYDEGNEAVKASQWYRNVLRQHPEHMECKLASFVQQGIELMNSQSTPGDARSCSWPECRCAQSAQRIAQG